MPLPTPSSKTEAVYQQKSDAELLRGSAFFSCSEYLSAYPDVAVAGQDPVEHYLMFGAAEGRDPSTSFSTLGYLKLYPDVVASKENPLIHFLRNGIFEGRHPGVSISHGPSKTVTGDGISIVVSSPTETNLLENEVLLKESGLFDSDYYLKANPDVASSSINPIHHFLEWGASEGRDPSEHFSNLGYLKKYPDVAKAKLNPLLHFLQYGRNEGRTAPNAKPIFPSVFELYEKNWPALRPLPVFNMPSTDRRVNIVTDSVSPSHLFGGVGTAIVLATILANRLDATLRIITRHDAPDATALNNVLNSNNLSLNNSFETVFAPNDGGIQLPVTNKDIFLTTSWWSTRATLEAVPRRQVVYLLQEDERMFYPYGDDRLLCSETLRERGIPVIVNTHLLLNHLATGVDPIDFGDRAMAFEPAFPATGEIPTESYQTGKKKFFFYSRPKNLRNLFWRGASALAQSIRIGVFDPDEWDFYWVGKDTPECTLPRGVKPILVEGMDWTKYQEFVATMDAALVLMDTPHPSYPPFDLAGAGAAVLTNRHGIKQDLSSYSRNILTCDLDEKSLLDGLSKVAALGKDAVLRRQYQQADSISRDWNTSLSQVMEKLADRFSLER